MESKLKCSRVTATSSKDTARLAAAQPPINDLINSKLNELKQRLAPKPFKQNFVDSLAYLIRLEHQKQLEFQTNIQSTDLQWSHLEYALHELKKICKQKHVILLLMNKMNLQPKQEQTELTELNTSTVNASTTTTTNSLTDDDDSNFISLEKIDLINELEDLNAANSDSFSLIRILIRLLFKLIKLNNEFTSSLEAKVSNLKLVLLSCLADLCHYDEVKLQAINDTNLKCLLRIFAYTFRLEMENLNRTVVVKKSLEEQQKELLAGAIKSTSKVLTDKLDLQARLKCFTAAKKFWTKMCRLAANLCVDKHSTLVKKLFNNEFFSSLCKCIEKHNQLIIQSQVNLTDVESNINDIEFLHSLIRFLKHSCELSKLKMHVLEYRFLVFLCRFIHKYNKNIAFSTDPCCTTTTTTTTAASTLKTEPATTPTPTSTSNDETPPILIILNEKYHTLCKDLIKNYLNLLDTWPSACSEFYNQIIEGNLIEHLLWLQLDDQLDAKSITSRALKSKQPTPFDYSEYSFNILYKLCRDYHACRAEFGRVGGLNKFITKIESFNAAESDKISDYEMKLIEIICFSCKESVNRFRLKEQNHLGYLVKLQQRLKQKLASLSAELSQDSALFNKLLVAICGFVHDPDSMNILLTSGLIDSFLSFLNDSYSASKSTTCDFSASLNEFKDSIVSLSNKYKKGVCLKSLLNSKNFTFNECKKRKASESLDPPAVLTNSTTKSSGKKSKLNSNKTISINQTPSSPPGLSTPFSKSSLELNNMAVDYSLLHYNEQNQSGASPTGSYCSLSPSCNPFSPTFSLSSPPAATTTTTATSTSRSNSAVMFHSVTSLSSLSTFHFSPSSSSNDTLASPRFNWSNSCNSNNAEDHTATTIQFSPSIKNEDSDIDMDDDEEEDDDDDQPIMIKVKPIEDLAEEEEKSDTSKKSLQLTNQQSIETINRTEGCVFYVLSQLSHGDKPNIYMFNNFESISICLLNYLKNAQVRNPRALRILNRLTKNHYCFQFFIQIQFPYKLKSILFHDKHNSPHTGKKDEDIEKEMNIYLNSNKVFFDAHSSFPSFESIEFTLTNNLKSQCISSSDHGYLSLIQMIKSTNAKRHERLACALVAPFILRNSKALHYIMIQLNGIDLVIDLLVEDKHKLKPIMCIKKILTFVSYKRDFKKLKEFYEQTRLKLNDSVVSEDNLDDLVRFKLDDSSEIEARKSALTKKSEYFNALLNGQFREGTNEQAVIEISDISSEAFQLLVNLIQTSVDTITCELTFDLCVEVVLACDRFILNDLKELFVSILVNQFMNVNTFVSVFKLAWLLNNSVMEQASVDYFLSKLNSFSNATNGDDDLGSDLDENLKCCGLVDYVFDCFKQEDCLALRANSNLSMMTSSECSQEKLLIDYLKRSLKLALGDIIKK